MVAVMLSSMLAPYAASPAHAAANDSSTFMFKNATTFNGPNLDMVQGYTPSGAGTSCPGGLASNWTCTWSSDTFAAGQVMAAGTTTVDLYAENNVQIGFRNAASAGVQPNITFRPAGTLGTAGNNNVTPGLPAGWAANDIHLAIIETRDNVASTMPGGWTQLNSAISGGTHRATLYWRRAVAGDTDPLVTHSGGDAIVARIIGFRGVSTTTAFDVANSFTVSAADFNTEAAGITTVSENAMLVFTAHMADNHTGITAPTPSPGTWTQAFFSATGNGSDAAIAAYYSNLVAPPTSFGTITMERTGALAAVSHGALLALRPAPTSLTINKPTDTVTDDVMIASIAFRPHTATVPTPSGWTLVRRINNANAWANSLAVYRKTATGSEPASYTWSFGSAVMAGGGIQSFYNVDTTQPNPIDAENGANTAPGSGTVHLTPSITTAAPYSMLVTSYGVANPGPDHWVENPAGSMNEAFDNFGGNEAVAGYWGIQAAVGATGQKQADSDFADVGNAHILALRPKTINGTLTVQLLHNTTVIGSGTVNVSSPGTPALVTASFATSGVTFANGDRLHVKVIAANTPLTVNARVWFDGATRQSRLVTPTITSECARPADPTYVAATAAAGQVTLQWSSANPILIVQKPNGPVTETPLDGTAYAAGNTIGAAGATVVYSGSSAADGSFTKTGLVNGTTYHYKAFARTASQCYSVALDTALDATPPTGGNPAWSYTLVPGGSMLKPGISGYGSLYTGSNTGRIIALDTTSGAHLWNPVTTTGVVQGWLSWLPGGWQYRKQITIDHTKVTGDLADFPVLISFTDPDLQTSAQPGTAISHVGSAAAATASVVLPAHQAGDLIIVFAARSAGGSPETVPSLPAGWTSIGTSQRNFWATRVGYKMAASGAETSGTWTNATRITSLVYRGANPTAPIGATATAGNTTGSVVTYPALTLTDSTTPPWVVGVAGHRTADDLQNPPAGMMNRAWNGSGFPGQVAAQDTNGGVSSWTAQTVTVSGSDAWDAWTIEIKPQPGGGDIVFTASDGATPLSHEIEQYDGTTGKLTAWVRVPTLSSTTDTVLYMYYGDPAAPDQQDRANVWDTGFKGVWHLSHDPAAAAPQMQDATSNPSPNDGTSSGMSAAQQVSGKTGGSLQFDGTNDFVSLGNPTPASLRINGELTVEAWINSSVPQASQAQFAKVVQFWGGTFTAGYGLFFNDTRTMIGMSTSNGTTQDNIFVPITVTPGAWHHVVGTWSPNPGSKVIYIDGIQQTPQASTNATIKSNTNWYVGIGNNEPGGCFSCFNGKIDEVRISNVARSAAWIATSYNSQSAPGTIPTTSGTFYTVGSAEQTVTGGTVIGGDQSGRVYSVDAFIGATNWTANLSAKADAIQAGVAVQMRTYSDAAFRAQYTTDVIFAASRNTTGTNCGTPATNNKLFALRADTGASLWTFNDTCTHAIDYIVGMPYVDYVRNRLYLATRGTGSTLWILNTLDGSVVQQLALGNLETSPSLSADGATVYVGSAAGRIYAVDAETFAATNHDLGSAIKSIVWEDWSAPGRLYFTTVDGNLWCLQHDGGASFTQVWKNPVAGASTPLLLDKLYVGSSDGRMHEFDTDGGNAKVFPASGTLDGTTVGDVSTEDGTHVFVGTSGGKLFKIQVPLP
jgi:hypothetical protein